MTSITKWDPFRTWFTLPRWFDEWDKTFTTQRGLKIHETDKNIIAEAVVAGVPTSDIEVHVEDGILTIKAEKTEEKEGKSEYRASSYQYYYTAALSGGRWDKATADIENGVVKVTIPKTEAAKPRKSAVKVKGGK